jgi:hypothetical protein
MLAVIGMVCTAEAALVDPGFEEGNLETYWGPMNANASSAFAKDGTYSAQLNDGDDMVGTWTSYIWQVDWGFAGDWGFVDGGDTITVSCDWYYSSSNPLVLGQVGRFEVMLIDDTGDWGSIAYFSDDMSVLTGPANTWNTMSVECVVEAGRTIQYVYVPITLNDMAGVEGGSLYVDNISIAAVPEPATMTLLGLGGIALLRRKRA